MQKGTNGMIFNSQVQGKMSKKIYAEVQVDALHGFKYYDDIQFIFLSKKQQPVRYTN